MAARASSAESCEPAWIWRFRNFSAITRSAERYGAPCARSPLRLCVYFQNTFRLVLKAPSSPCMCRIKLTLVLPVACTAHSLNYQGAQIQPE